jgi:hypothetical protein
LKGEVTAVKKLSFLLICLVLSSIQLTAKDLDEQTIVVAAQPGWKNEVAEIEKEIDKLQNQRNLYLAKATRLQNQGDRLQFENNNLIDARRAWQQAQIHREIATRIQEEIDQLENKKQKILESNGVIKQDSKATTK